MNDMTGKTVVVTGANSGIGKETAIALAHMGALVVLAVRNATKGEAARKELCERSGRTDAEVMTLDLASFASVRAFAAAFLAAHDRLDVLVLNAGILVRRRLLTEDGHDTQFEVNHLSHFLLVQLLRDRLVASAPSRVVVVASDAHRSARRGLDFDDLEHAHRRYGGFSVYSHTKLANILFTRELARRLDGTGVTANSVHPGFVASNLAREGDAGVLGTVISTLGRPFARTAEQGAQTSIYVASSPQLDGVTGQYFANSAFAKPSQHGEDDAAAARLWEVSERLTAG